MGKTPERPPQPERLPQYLSRIVLADFLLKHLSNFWRSLDLPLINCEIELDLSWTKDCVLSEHYNSITGTNFMIISTKLYVPVVTLSINDNIEFLENIKAQ